MYSAQQYESGIRKAYAAGDYESAQYLTNQYKQSIAPNIEPGQRDNPFEYSIDQAQKMLGAGVETVGRGLNSNILQQYGQNVQAQQDIDIARGGYQSAHPDDLIDTYKNKGWAGVAAAIPTKAAESAASGGAAIVGTGLAAASSLVGAPAWMTAVLGYTTLGTTFGLGVGEATLEQKEKLNDFDTATSVGTGIVIALLDRVGAKGVIPTDALQKMSVNEIEKALRDAGKEGAAQAFGSAIKNTGKATGKEFVTEGAQELAIMGGAATQGAEYTPREIAGRTLDASAAGGFTGGAVRAPIEIGSAAYNALPQAPTRETVENEVLAPAAQAVSSVLGDRRETGSPTEQGAKAEFARRLMLDSTENGFDLDNINVGATKGARAAVDNQHVELMSALSGDGEISRDADGHIEDITPGDGGLFAQIKQAYELNPNQIRILKKALKKAGNKVKNIVTNTDMQEIVQILGNTPDSLQFINLLLQTNEVTNLHSEGYKGGITWWTDMANPLDTARGNYNPMNMLSSPMNLVASGGALATQGATLGIPLAGRAIDKYVPIVGGRRSPVAKYLRDNINKPALPLASGPSLIAAAKRAQEQEDAEAASFERAGQTLLDEQLAQGGDPNLGSPRDIFGQGTGLSTIDAIEALEQMASETTNEDVRAVLQANIDSLRSGTQAAPQMSNVVAALRNRVLNDPELQAKAVSEPQRTGAGFNLQQPQAQGAAPVAPGMTQQQINYERGVQANKDRAAKLQADLMADNGVSAVDKAVIGTALDELQYGNLGVDPIQSLNNIVQRMREANVATEAMDTYLMPALTAIAEQQARNPQGSQTEVNFSRLPPKPWATSDWMENLPDIPDLPVTPANIKKQLIKIGFDLVYESKTNGKIKSIYLERPQTKEEGLAGRPEEIRISDHELGTTVYGEPQGLRWETDLVINPDLSLRDHVMAAVNKDYEEGYDPIQKKYLNNQDNPLRSVGFLEGRSYDDYVAALGRNQKPEQNFRLEYTPPRRQKSGKYVGSPRGINTPQKLYRLRQAVKEIAKQGEYGRFWYERSGRAILDITGGNKEDARKLVAAIAITSPNTGVDTNFEFAIQAYYQYKNGEPIRTGLYTTDMSRKIEAVFREGKDFSGRKVGNFEKNLLRAIDGELDQGVTTDLWMMRAFGYPTDAPSDLNYNFVENETQKIADELGWEPQQVQAAIWVEIKARMESEPVKTATDKLSQKKGYFKFVKNKKGKDVRKFKDLKSEQAHAQLWIKKALAYDPTQSDRDKAKFDYADSALRKMAQISVESVPTEDANHMPEIFDAPDEQIIEYHHAIDKALLSDDGYDIIARELGMLQMGVSVGIGSWEGRNDPVSQQQVVLPRQYSVEKDGVVSPDALDLLSAYIAVKGILLKQKGIGYHRPFFKASNTRKDSDGMQYDIGRPFSKAETQRISALLEGTGITPLSSPTGVRFINFADEAGNPYSGLPNFKQGKNNPDFQTTVTDAIELLELDSDVESGELIRFVSDNGLIENDWTVSTNGEDYINKGRLQGRPDLQRRVFDLVTKLQPRIRQVEDEFSERYGWSINESLNQAYKTPEVTPEFQAAPALASQASPAVSIPKPTPKQTQLQLPLADAVFTIGKKGSEFEDGIPNLDEAEKLADAMDLAVFMFNSAELMQQYAGNDDFQVSGVFTPDDDGGAGEIGVLRSKYPGAPDWVNDIGTFTTYIHELAHSLESRGSESNYVHRQPQGRFFHVADDSFRRKIIDAYDGDPKVKSEIDRLQETGVVNINPAMKPNERPMQTRVRAAGKDVIGAGNKNAIINFRRTRMLFDRAKQGEYIGDHIDPTSQQMRYLEYVKSPPELAVDPLIAYLSDPKTMKRKYPKLAKMTRDHFNDMETRAKNNFPITFHANPITALLAVILAAMASGEGEEELEPGALSLPPGALSAA